MAQPATSKTPTYMTVREVAHDLRLTGRGVRAMIADGRLPAYKIGRNVLRVRREDVDALLEPLPTTQQRRGAA